MRKRNMKMHIYWCQQKSEPRGRYSASYSRKTNILNVELRVRPWNYTSAAAQIKHGSP